MRLPTAALTFLLTLTFPFTTSAQTPPPPAKRLPPAGITIPDTARTELTAATAALATEISALRADLTAANKTTHLALLPDVEILHKAVDWALRYDEFFDLKQIPTARHFLAVGRERAASLRVGQAPWLDATGTIIRGYRSKLDDSVQPFALVVPADWKRHSGPARRLDVVLLGRGEKRTELAFIAEREKSPGEIVPAGAIVLQPYGRFCNATKFAGEVDVMETLQLVRNSYPIDPGKIVVRGFSMGGASTWHLATHYPGLWAAAAPGAGFAETAVYAKALAPGKPERTWWEQKLWRWYDATTVAGNLFNVSTVAYSGELDPQKQAADIMTTATAAAAEGISFTHLIGPKTAHKYHPETKAQLAARLAELTAKGRDAVPREIRFSTYTLRYPQSAWLSLEGLEKHWERADTVARLDSPSSATLTTKNVSALSLALPSLRSVTIDGQSLSLPPPSSPHPSSTSHPSHFLRKTAGTWSALFAADTSLRKSPGLTGPINDAFMEPFVFVRPTGKPLNARVGAWTTSELAHATKMWRDIFRGELIVKDDTAITADDLAHKHLILWGDASSNAVIAKLLATKKLPLTWDAQHLTFRGERYDATHHAPVLVFPNPLSPQPRYIVLNSGIDFREEAYGTNSLQTPKLPDYAIIDLREPAGPRWPGKISTAGFFDESWK